MNQSAQEAQLVCGVVAILEDVLPGRGTVKAKKVCQAIGPRKQVGGVSSLGRFGDED